MAGSDYDRYFCEDTLNGGSKPHKGKRRILPDRIKQDFCNKALVSYEYKDLSVVQEVSCPSLEHQPNLC